MAGALGVRLGGRNVYDGMPEDRPTLGNGPAPAVADIGRAVKLSQAVGAGAVLMAGAAAVAIGRRSRAGTRSSTRGDAGGVARAGRVRRALRGAGR